MTTARESLAALPFPQRQRLCFVESMALWEGSVPRQRLCDAFGVSANHITKDLTLYRSLLPNNLTYDASSRTWRPSGRFRPAISAGTAEEYLGLLRLALEPRGIAAVPTLEGATAAAVLPEPKWAADPKALQNVTRAAREGTGVRVRYQAMSAPDPEERVLWPHGLVHAGFRWHVRAYDDKRGRFGDFVLARICEADPHEGQAPIEPSNDAGWSTEETADIMPNPKLSKGQQQAIAREYGMAKDGGNWHWNARMRQCLMPYFLYWHRLDVPSKESRVVARNLKDLTTFSSVAEE